VHNADLSTLVRAARNFCGKEPRFAATVALFAVTHLLAGGGYDPPVSEVSEAIKHIFAAAHQIGAVGWARQELGRFADGPCNPGRDRHQDAGRHGETLGSAKPRGQRCTVRERTLKALINKPDLDTAEQIFDDQSSNVVSA